MEGRYRDKFEAPGRLCYQRNNARKRLITQMSSGYRFILTYISVATA